MYKKTSTNLFAKSLPVFLIAIFLLFSALGFSQTITIAGKVTDSQTREPVVGASVMVKGRTIGTLTEANGRFSLRNVAKNDSLIISHAGYESANISAERSEISISLNPGRSLGEVIVTAENRAVSVQNVPIAIDLVRGVDLRKLGVVDLTQLPALAPGLQFEENTIFSSFTVRGVGSHDGAAELSDQAITVGIDGEYINRPVALGAAMFDIDRIEVLKGPQGTLYGRNATAGAINIIARKPTNRLEGDLSANFGNYSSKKVEANINVPVSKGFAFRAAGLLSKHDGYRNGGSAGRVDDGDVLAGRLSLNIKPTNAFSIYLAGESSKVEQTAPAQYGVGVTAAVTDSGTSPSNFSPLLPKDFNLAAAGAANSDQWAIRSKIEYNFGKVALNYAGGYRDVDFNGYQPLNGFVPEIFTFDNNLTYQTQSHEFRINGESEKLIWQGGVFYGNEQQDVARGLILPALSGNFGGKAPYLNFFLRDVESSTTGVFAQATFNLTEKLSFTGGLRYTSDKKDRVASDLTAPPFVPGAVVFTYPNRPVSFTQNGVTPVTNVTNNGKWNQTTWLADLEHRFDNNKLLFAKVSTGYKAGGFDNIGVYKPEKLTAIEIGSKNKFANNRLKLNLSAFNYTYKDQQVSVFISTAVGGAIQNAGKTRVYGVETETEWLATKDDKFKLTINYLDAKFKDLPTQANRYKAPAVVVNLAGNRPVQSPKWTLVGRYDHNFAISSGEISFGIQSLFKSDYHLSAFNWAGDKQKSYTKTDINLTYAGKGNRWDIGVYVQNLEDNRILNFAAFTGNGIDVYNWIFGNPRTFGVQLNWHFKGNIKE